MLKSILTAALLLSLLVCAANAQSADPNPCPNAQQVPAALRIPARLQPGEPFDFEKQVLGYLRTLEYRKLGWCEDKGARDTGPHMNGATPIVHPPRRIFSCPHSSHSLSHR